MPCRRGQPAEGRRGGPRQPPDGTGRSRPSAPPWSEIVPKTAMSAPTSPRAQRRLAAILAADVVAFSSLMGKDEEGTFALIKSLQQEVIKPAVQQHQGRVVKTTGDGFLIEFASPVEAVRCALAVQKALTSGPLQLRIGINLGDVIMEPDGDIFGDGVNVAARQSDGQHGPRTALRRQGV